MAQRERHEQTLVAWLVRHVGLVSTTRFLERFAGYRVPKRSQYLIHKQRERVLIAVALRLVEGSEVLPADIVDPVSRETGLPPLTVRNIWSVWRRKGRPALERGASTAEAVSADKLSW
jgi:hypothetical protein